MTDDNIELTRRKILGGVGAVGVAGAAAGFGSTAFFSDQETFTNNRLVAGELDLKVDWEEHYSDWSADENDIVDEDGEFEVSMEPPDDPSGYRPFPPGTNESDSDPDPLLWVPEAFVDDFMANTAIDAYPDSDNDGSAEFPIEEMNGRAPCDFLADVGADDEGLDPDSDPLGRTDNEDTRLENGDPAPLVNLQDVKPGDFGEITFSTHLCDNPGYLWMNMPGGLSASENGVTEPEAADEDEDQNQDGSLKDGEQGPPEVELVDEIQTTIWYDDCNNLLDCEEKIDLMIVADTSGSIEGQLNDSDDTDQADVLRDAGNNFLTELDARTTQDQLDVGLLTFNGPGDAGEDQPSGPGAVFDRPAWRAGLGDISQFDTGSGLDLTPFLPNEGNGNTPMPHAIDLAQKILLEEGRSDAKNVILLITDGLPDYVDDSSPTTPYAVEENEGGPLATTGLTKSSEVYDGSSDGVSSSQEQQETEDEAVEVQGDGIAIRVAGIGLDPSGNAFLRDRIAGDDADPANAQPSFFYDPTNFGGLDALAATIAEDIAGGLGDCEEIIFQGSLREAADRLTADGGQGIPLVGDLPAEAGGGSGRNCFAASATHCFGLSWWLPLDHGNEVQTDSVNFDIGFYTEQCRHNNGSGIANAD